MAYVPVSQRGGAQTTGTYTPVAQRKQGGSSISEPKITVKESSADGYKILAKPSEPVGQITSVGPAQPTRSVRVVPPTVTFQSREQTFQTQPGLPKLPTGTAASTPERTELTPGEFVQTAAEGAGALAIAPLKATEFIRRGAVELAKNPQVIKEFGIELGKMALKDMATVPVRIVQAGKAAIGTYFGDEKLAAAGEQDIEVDSLFGKFTIPAVRTGGSGAAQTAGELLAAGSWFIGFGEAGQLGKGIVTKAVLSAAKTGTKLGDEVVRNALFNTVKRAAGEGAIIGSVGGLGQSLQREDASISNAAKDTLIGAAFGSGLGVLTAGGIGGLVVVRNKAEFIKNQFVKELVAAGMPEVQARRLAESAGFVRVFGGDSAPQFPGLTFDQIKTDPKLFQQTRSLENLTAGGYEEYKVGEIMKNFDEERLLKSPIQVGRFDDGSLVVTSGHNRLEVLKRAKEEGLLTHPDSAYINLTEYPGPEGLKQAVAESILSNIRSKSVKDVNVIDLAVRGAIDEKQLKEALAFDEKKIKFVTDIVKTFRENNLTDFWNGSVGSRLAQFKSMDFGVLSERLNFLNRVGKELAAISDKLSADQLQAVQDTLASKIGEFLAPSKTSTLAGAESQIAKYFDTIRTGGFDQAKLIDLFGQEGTVTTVKKSSGVQALRKAIADAMSYTFLPEDIRLRLKNFQTYLEDPDVIKVVNEEVGQTSKSEKTMRFLNELASGEVDISTIKNVQLGSSTGRPHIASSLSSQPVSRSLETGSQRPSLNIERLIKVEPSSSMRYTSFSHSRNLNDLAISNVNDYLAITRNNARKNLSVFSEDVQKATGELPMVRVKEANSLLDKVRDYLASGKNLSEVSDVLGARIIVSTDQIDRQIQNIQKAFKIQEGKIKNYFLSPTDFGYRGVNINVELPSGMLAEIQIHTPLSSEIAEATHPLYKKWERKKRFISDEKEYGSFLADQQEANRLANEIISRSARETPTASPGANAFPATAGYTPVPAAKIEDILLPTEGRSRLALKNQERSAQGQPELPRLNQESLTYEDSIMLPLQDSQEALDASILNQVFEHVVETEKPKHYPDLVTGFEETGKDISGFVAQGRDLWRNFERFFGKKYEQAKALILDPFDAAKGDFVEMQRTLGEDLKNNVVDRLGIKAGSKESEAVMNYGERRINPAYSEWDYPFLVEKFGKEKADNIVKADAWFRAKYDEILDTINVARKKIYGDIWAKKDSLDDEIRILREKVQETEKVIRSKRRTDTLTYNRLQRRSDRLQSAVARREELLSSDDWWRGKTIPKRPDYYRHFRELTGIEGLKNIFESPSGIDPALSGISPFTKPKSRFLSFAQKRLGFKSSRDAVGGYLEYIPNASYAVHIDPHIKDFRNLAADLALQTKESRNVNNFIEYLQDFANDLAGKTNPADRYVQKVIPGGRKTFSVINWLNRRVKANVIIGNASSSVAQIFNVPQGIGSAKGYSLAGALRTIGGLFTENAPMAKSTFIKERYFHTFFDQFDTSWMAKPKQFASWLTGVLDEAGTKFIWNAHYQKAVGEGIANPIKYADDVTRKLVAGRGIGEVPLVQRSQLFQIAAPFQLEVGNMWWVMKDFVSAGDFKGLATFFVVGWLFNQAAKKIRGSDVSFDPINAVYEGVMELEAEKDPVIGFAKLGGRLTGEVLSNMPFGQTLATWYPEYGIEALGKISRAELFGKGDPTRYGGGLVVVRGLQDPLFKIVPGFGGQQLERTIDGIKSYYEGGVRDSKGKFKYRVEDSPLRTVQQILFGPGSTPEAQQYYDKSSPEKKSTRAPGLPSLK